MMYSFQAWMNAKTDGRDETGRDQRQHDPHEGAETGRAVDHRRLLELLRDAGDEPAQRPDAERKDDRDVGDDHAGELVDLMDAAEHDVERDDQRGERHHLHREDHHHEHAGSAEAEPRERQGGEERERDRRRHDRADDDQAVLDVVPEVRPPRSRRGS